MRKMNNAIAVVLIIFVNSIRVIFRVRYTEPDFNVHNKNQSYY